MAIVHATWRLQLHQITIKSEDCDNFAVDNDDKIHNIMNGDWRKPSVFSFSSSHSMRSAPCPERFRTYITPFSGPSPLLTTRSLHQNTIRMNSSVNSRDGSVDESKLLSMWSAGFTIVN
eukprot:341137_1